MKVFPVALESGETASLRLDGTAVWITAAAARWRRLLRWSAGSVLVGLGLAAIANGLAHSVNPTLGLWCTAAVITLIAVSAVAAATAGALIWRAERRPTDRLAAAEVTFARSEARDGRVTVTVERADGATRQFSATGVTGARTAQLFARLLATAAPTGDRPVQAR
ncbi:hypothetical protein [Micromonospora aurantiaca (nom. illeg.)]|uniref:hypothetical protein n=1 Tax=Micromonospora aurantiaca (nom. illeg.) TaxID=47850 RepID=UPI003F49D0B0